MIAVLYCDARGPYPGLGVDCWTWEDRAQMFLTDRDARSWWGPRSCVAHPPCGPWGRLRHLSKHPEQRQLAVVAVTQVRAWGGVLEHPAGSLLWAECGLPRPGDPPDARGGYTIEVCQSDWGHVARKRTWLYLVGVPRSALISPPPREPTHWISGGRCRRGKKAKTTPVPPGIKVCSAEQRRRTPPAFARYLVALAEAARVNRLESRAVAAE